MPDHQIHVSEEVRISESYSLRMESHYLFMSNQERCRNLLREVNGNFSNNEEKAIDFLVSLHLVLEIGLNTFFRNISLMGIKKQIAPLEIADNIDRIGFIDKVILFIYNSKFNFEGCMDKAEGYHKIIGKLRNFTEVRNGLLHGHSVSTSTDESGSRDSHARNLTRQERIEKQMNDFRFILEGVRFYFDRLDSSITSSGKEDFKRAFLDDGFLNT